MMNAATFNAYLDMVGISHKTAAKECSVDRQTIKRWCLGKYDIPSAIEKWILDKVKMHDACVEEICKNARIESTAEGVTFIPYERYREPREGGETALSAALKERSWRMAAISNAIYRLRTEGYVVVCDYDSPEEEFAIETPWHCHEQTESRFDSHDTRQDRQSNHQSDYNRYDRYVIGKDGSYIGDSLLIKAVIDGEIEKPFWIPREDIEKCKSKVRKSTKHSAQESKAWTPTTMLSNSSSQLETDPQT